ncbi:AI-2E family transporter [Anaerobutyricum hallii]|uniref:AI-2E family transporter n=2 Tax=Anaerobutyricum hallii TaxID=39488 RepID=A0A414B6P3_9FIRM|nr:AI-2E family transporter [Eubacterium sp.]MBP0063096.1 AI-2E family transporter [Anaerobutyricum hallii]MBS7166126.1 AI-2E family transporter [Anaerobutyricum hallii]MBT9716040.1 AI-2E family transporter [Anaerobutyricum hallii]RHC66070.1 AI-2E family transporter [Anaerobutyricum hallii]
MKDDEMKRYLKIGITGAAILASGILCAFVLFKMPVIISVLKGITEILKPFLYGVVFAYLLAPLCNKIEEKLFQIFPKAKTKARRFICFIAIVISLCVAIAVIWLIIMMIIPQVWDSVMKIIQMVPQKLIVVNNWIEHMLENQPELQAYFEEFSSQAESNIDSLLNVDTIQKVQSIINSLSVQLFGVLGVVKNIFLGLLISAYLLGSRKLFGAQAGLILHGVFSDKWAKIIEEEIRYTDKMFNGFLVGKIIDSAIIGLLCFAGTSIMGFEAPAFISVIIGITNIIPFFGPFIGAIPCGLLLLLENPMHCLYFIIFIFVLQQLDGNVIGPKILGNTTGVSSFWVLFAILLFGGMWGVVGMVIGVPLFAVIYDIIRKLVYRGLRKHKRESMITDYEEKYHKS